MSDPACLDYGNLFRQAALSYQAAGRALRRQCEQAGLPYDAEFWTEAADDALQAAALVERLQTDHQPLSCIANVLKRVGLHPFDEVVETANPDLLVINARPLGSASGVSPTQARLCGVKEQRFSWNAAERAHFAQVTKQPKRRRSPKQAAREEAAA